MPVFTYANPRVIHWGRGSVAHLRELKAERVAVVTTRSLRERLDALPLRPSCVVTVGQHAPLAQIDAAVEAVRGADAIVSFGGGSVIDAAKIVSVRLGALPHTAVPTTLSVAELAAGAGYTNEAGDKAGKRDPRQLVDAVVYDPELTLWTPLELWLSTGIRALDHAVEGFLAEGEHPFNDVMALEAIRRLFESLPRARSSPSDIAIRGENQLAAWFSFTLPGASASGLSHVMGKQIGARHGIPHGVTSCLLLPHVMRYLAPSMPDRAALLPTPDEVADLIASLGLPQHVAAYGIGEPELRRAAEELAGRHRAEDLLAIYLAAL
jgi:alcohol dehydrogenase class IV